MKQTKYPGYYVTESGEVYRDANPRDYTMGKANENGLVKMTFGRRGHPKYPQHWYPFINVSLKDENGNFIGQRKESVHRLVAEVFVPNPNNHPEVDHINGIKDDNRAVNLRWVTRFDNSSEPNAKSYTITDTLTGKVWKGYNLREWVTKNYDFLNSRTLTKDRDVKEFARDLANARTKKTKIWNLIVEY